LITKISIDKAKSYFNSFDKNIQLYWCESFIRPNSKFYIFGKEDKQNLLIIFDRPNRKPEECIELNLITNNCEELISIIDMLSTQEKYRIISTEDLSSISSSLFSLEKIGERNFLYLEDIDLLCSQDFSFNNIKQLKKEHKPYVKDINSERIQRYWEFSNDLDGFETYGIIENGKLISACALGPVRKVSIPTRKVIHIFTEENFRKNGYAKRMLYFISKLLLENDIIPAYEVDDDNLASFATAKSVGYKDKLKSYGYFLTIND